MLKKFSLYNESEMKRWDDFVDSHPNGSPFHLSSWIRTIHKTYSFEPLLYGHLAEDGNILSAFPLFHIKSLITGARIVSLPFSDSCGPLCKDQCQEEELLKKVIEEYKDRVKYIEIRGVLSNKDSFISHDYYKSFVLELLPDPAKVIKKIDKRTIQYSIRKAQKSGIEIREENSPWGAEEFYRLNKLTRMKHGVPSQPAKFFRNLFDNMVPEGKASILLAIYEKKVIAAGLFLKSKEIVEYKYNASDPEYLLRSKTTPNHLLTWHAIEQACLQGYRLFDFGRTSPDNAGLMRYKEMWGAKPSDLIYHYYPEIRGAASTEEKGFPYRILTKIWQRLPEPVAEFIGPKIYKHTA